MKRLYDAVKALQKEALVVFNTRMRLQSDPQKAFVRKSYMSHFEIESPHRRMGLFAFSDVGRYCLPLDKSSKYDRRFHDSWGDFGG